MALQGGLIQDQNLNVQYNGASVGGKTNAFKALRKGGLGGRRPLGDLSNSVKPTPNQASKKQNSNIFSFPEKETGASKIAYDASKKKSISKASDKVQTSGRKALSDISNSGKPRLPEASKKNHNAKLSAVAEEPLPPSAIVEEQFLHNHHECIKAQTKAMDVDQFLKTVGLDNDFSKQLASARATPLLSELKPKSSPLRLVELEEMTEQLIEDRSPGKHDPFIELDSPPPCKTPKSSVRHMRWKDHDYTNFMLLETPELLKH